MKDPKKSRVHIQYMPVLMCLGLSGGMALGSVLGNISAGMCIGMAVGMCVGLSLDARKPKEPEDVPPYGEEPAEDE